jgi:ubiquinone/menaquinone biosynthesis C-methylase UbiE
MRDFEDDVFAGTASYYSKYRARYPSEIFADIAINFNLDGNGWLLDLGCGTGELAIPLAKYFENVLAIDPDEPTLHEGSKKARNLNIDNIAWQKSRRKP